MNQSVSQARLSSFLHPTKGKATVEVHGPPGLSSQVIPSLMFRLCCVIEGESLVFPVDILAQADVVDLKKKIQSERAMDTLQDVGPHTLELWKPKDITTIVAKPVKTLPERIKSMEASLEILDPMDSLSASFPTQPSKTYIHIVVKRTDFRESKRRRVDIDEPRTPTKVQGDDSEMPQTPVRSEVAPVKFTPPRLRRRELIPAMEGALQPFTRFMSDLAEGKLDKYFDPTELEPRVTHLGVTLPSGPILLLHDLGNNPEDTRLTNVFRPDTVHLYAASGSGKTRVCLEGLCHQWGFYISCRAASASGATGSTDFRMATQTMTEMSGWDGRTEETGGASDPEKNINVAGRAFEMLICARLFILKHLLEKLPLDTDATTARRRWVFVQVMPPCERHPIDIFAVVLRSLRAADSRDMADLARSMIKDFTKIAGESIFPSNQQFCVVIDEAQSAIEYMNEYIRSMTTGTDRRPVLTPFYGFLLNSELIKGITLAGTGPPKKMVENAVYSRTAKHLDTSRFPLVFNDVGLFSNDGTNHRAYVDRYVSFTNTASDVRLKQRILYWLSGRYRFTASFIELLLFTQSASRHRVLTAFIFALTGFLVTDAIDLEEEETPLSNGILEHITHFYGPISEENFKKLNGKYLSYTFDALMRWRIGSQPTAIVIEGDVHQTIASGIGHLKIIKADLISNTEDKFFAYLCEPLVVLHLSSVFACKEETTTLSWLSDATPTARNNSSLGYLFEEAVLMIILQMFGGEPRALSDAFHTDQPWAARKVVLVSLKRRADGQTESCPVSWTSGSSDRLGFKATSPTQVIEFLNNPEGKCFLFPDTHMGPDLLWFFQDWETKELILANAQGKLSETLSRAKWQRALQTVDPGFFYTVKKKKEGCRVQYAPSKYPGLLEDVMSALDVKLGPEEYEPSVSDQRPVTRSVTKSVEESASQSQRPTPKYLRIIATPNDHQKDRLKAEWKGDVGVLRSECVQQYFPNVVWTTPASVT